MKINDLTLEFNGTITNKEMIDALKANGFTAKSHMQNATDEMIDFAREYFKDKLEKKENVIPEKIKVKAEQDAKSVKPLEEARPIKAFQPNELIPCRSVAPHKVVAVGADRQTVYHWQYFGDVEYVAYKDLQALRRTIFVMKPLFIIEDADLCYQWRRELGDTYKYFLGVEYPEEFFDVSDDEFTNLLTKAPDVLKDVIRITAMSMIQAKNYPSVQKITIIDNTLGTCIKDFL